MTDEEKQLLSMCQPEVILQAHKQIFGVIDHVENDRRNRVFCVASRCESHGWLEFVREKEFDQCVYRITKAGADALALKR